MTAAARRSRATAAVASAVADTPEAVEVEAYRCEGCGETGVAANLGDANVYECSRCGQVFGGEEGNRCPDCRIFAQKVGEGVCESCTAGPVELVTMWGIENTAEGWVLGDSPEEVIAEAADIAERNTPEAKAAAAANREASIRKSLDAIDARRAAFQAEVPTIVAALTAAGASEMELDRYNDEYAGDSHSQTLSRETFARLCRLAAPGVPDDPIPDHDPDIDTLGDSVLKKVRLESEAKQGVYIAAIPTITAALTAANAEDHELEHFTGPFSHYGLTSALRNETLVALCRAAVANTSS